MQHKAIFDKFLSEIKGKLNIINDKSEENSFNTLNALWNTAAGNRVSAVLANKMDTPFLASAQHELLEELIKNRLAGVPLAHLTERQHFLGLEYILNKGHYIPRKETELLARTVIDLLQLEYTANKKVKVIDLCSGIGTITLAIAYYCKNTLVFGTDIYEPAIIAAEVNAKNFGLEKLVKFYHANLFDPFEFHEVKGKTDVIVSAPPYISTVKVPRMAKEIADHEPKEAFDAGPFGISIFNELISKAPDYLRSNGYLIFECGLGQGEFLVKKLNSNKNYNEVYKICDEHGNIRVLKARKAGE